MDTDEAYWWVRWDGTEWQGPFNDAMSAWAVTYKRDCVRNAEVTLGLTR